MPVSTPRDETLAGRTRQMKRTIGGVRRGDVAAIHAARTTTRRREVVPLLALDRSRARKLVRRLRSIGRRLGRLRDLDSQQHVLEGLLRIDGLGGPLLQHMLEGTRAQAARRRERLGDERLVARLERMAERLRAVVGDLEQEPDATSRARPFRWAAQARVARCLGDVREHRKAG